MSDKPKKRNVFFSFYYADVMRVNVVRLSGEFKVPEKPGNGRSIEGFYDKSLWESSQKTGPEALKTLIRDGVKNTSVVCALAGSRTFERPWVRYELARSVIDKKGLLTVHINSIKHHRPPHEPAPLGPNPAFYLGIGKAANGNFYLCERLYKNDAWEWSWYKDYTNPVDVPAYMPEPVQGHPRRLSEFTSEYVWDEDSHNKIGGWIDAAAQAAGR